MLTYRIYMGREIQFVEVNIHFVPVSGRGGGAILTSRNAQALNVLLEGLKKE